MHRIRRPVLVAIALLLAACASTTIRDSWYDPEYRGAAFRKVLVLGVLPNMAERRQYEDVMVTTINATGAQGIPAYRFLPGQERASEAELDRAVGESGADALLMSRLLRVDTQAQVSTQRVSPAPGPRGPVGPGSSRSSPSQTSWWCRSRHGTRSGSSRWCRCTPTDATRWRSWTAGRPGAFAS